MTIDVKVPTQLRPLTGGEGLVVVEEASSVKELIDRLGKTYPDLLERLLDETGQIRRFINVYIGDEDIRFLEGMESKVSSGDKISILPAVAGG